MQVRYFSCHANLQLATSGHLVWGHLMRNLECVIAIATVEWHTVSFLRACFIRGSFVCGNQLGLASSRWGFGPEARNFFFGIQPGPRLYFGGVRAGRVALHSSNPFQNLWGSILEFRSSNRFARLDSKATTYLKL